MKKMYRNFLFFIHFTWEQNLKLIFLKNKYINIYLEHINTYIFSDIIETCFSLFAISLNPASIRLEKKMIDLHFALYNKKLKSLEDYIII